MHYLGLATTSDAFQSLTLPFATKMQRCSRVSVSVLISNLIPKTGQSQKTAQMLNVPEM